VRVAQVGGLAVQRAGDHLRAVALGLEEPHPVRDERTVERGRGLDPEPVGGGVHGADDLDAVGPGLPDPREIDRGDVRIGGVPRPAGPRGDETVRDRAAGGADHAVALAVRRRAGHQIGDLRVRREVAHLVGPEEAGRLDGRGARGLDAAGRGEHGGGEGAQQGDAAAGEGHRRQSDPSARPRRRRHGSPATFLPDDPGR